jgi:predicted nucleotidyltransferase
MGCARQAADALRQEHGARRAVLFDSPAHAAWFDPDTDVDLAVEGLFPGAFFDARRTVERFFPGRRVDLIEYETAGGSLREAIDRDGLEV